MNSLVTSAVLVFTYMCNVSIGFAQVAYTCGSNMTVCPGTYVVCSCTISATNSLYNRWKFSPRLCGTIDGSDIQLNRIGVLCSNEHQYCGSDIRAWNEPSSSTLCEVSTIFIRASHDLDGLAFECQNETNGSNGTPTSYGRTVLSVISTPESPSITSVKSDDPTVLTIGWSPSEKGSRPSSFNVTISIRGVNVSLSTASVAFEDGRLLPYSYTFTGLISDTYYNVSVVSINCAGISRAVHQASQKTGNVFNKIAMYLGIPAFVILIVLVLLCAAICYKCRKANRHQGDNIQLPSAEGHNNQNPSFPAHSPIASFPEGQNNPLPLTEVKNPPAPTTEGFNHPVPSTEGLNHPALSSKGQNLPAPSTEGLKHPALSSEGQNLPAPYSEGQNYPAPSTEDFICIAPSSEGQSCPVPSTEGLDHSVPLSEVQNSPAVLHEGQIPLSLFSEGHNHLAPFTGSQLSLLPCEEAMDHTPDLASLLNDVAALIPAKWRSVGVQLKLPTGTLDEIQAGKSDQSMLLFEQVFIRWRSLGTSPYTWETMINALSSRAVGEMTLADKLITKYCN